MKTLEGIHETLSESLKPYRKKLLREPTHEDREKLLQIPIRRISQFDIEKNKDEIVALENAHRDVEKSLKNVKKYAIEHLKKLVVKFGSEFPRKTRFKSIEEIDRKAIETKEIKVGFDLATGFVGTKVSGATFPCTNFDKLLTFSKDGTYKVMPIPEKQYIEGLIWAGVADKKTVLTVVYRNKNTRQVWAKRFIVTQFILEKVYRYFDEEGELELITVHPDPVIELQFTLKIRPRSLSLKEIPIAGSQTRGVRLAKEKVKKIVPLKKY